MGWFSVSVRVPPELTELLGEALIARGSAGVWEPEPGAVTAYFDDAVSEEAIQRVLTELSITPHDSAVLLEPVEDQDWLARWRAGVTPLRISDRLVIAPSWHETVPKAGEWVVRLDPEMAFGTGHHDTTRMCLELLDERLRRGDRPTVLDLGTGSGILAIVAAKLGAGPITAADIDPVACEIARRNASLNAVSELVSVVDAWPSARQGSFDVIVANLTADDLVALMPRIVAALTDGGEAILSGILVTLEEEVTSSLSEHGGRVLERRESGEWAALRLAKRTPALLD